MTNLERLLSQYAAYHLDRNNIVTHFVGIPLIVFSILSLTARAGVEISGVSVTLASVLIVLSILYYISLDKLFGILMLIIMIVAYPFAAKIAALPMWSWLGASIGIFVVGWGFQFVGHYFEKKKPAFVDDLIGLAIGPLFVLAEFVFLLGFRKPLHQRILKEAQMKRAEMDMKPQTAA
ncbi:putative membrane protein YGL010W [Acinetobacter sp. BIGb0102]|uniref:Mpo1 family 2-hydroxy fatty acid dioxygenase n=1 Tax=Acinetobacter sp. BIGb0102 TaxID=2485131 RepID=UPI000F516231|nr:Mpo1-like protein [Acinetobacter sp. BIGb0102]RPE31750.1 putative membrane protein YGL010W [Acinetobacter sp. BIGb0102]